MCKKSIFILVFVVFFISNINAQNTINLDVVQQRKFDYYLYEAQRFKMLGDYEKTRNYLIECLKIDNTSSICFFELANLHIAANDFKGAQDFLEQAVSHNGKNKWYKILLADVYQKNKHYLQAVGIYQSLIEDFPNNEEYIYSLAQLYAFTKQYSKAINSYNLLEEKIGLNEIISLEKQKLYLSLGKKKQAYKEIEVLIKEYPNEPKYMGYLGDVYLYNKEFEKARDCYFNVIKKDPDNGLGYYSLANLFYLNKDTVEFLKYFTKGILSKSLSIDVKLQKLIPYVSKEGHSNIITNDYLDTLFHKLTIIHPYEAKGYVYYANFLKTIGDLNGSVLEYKKGIDLDPSNASLWQELLFIELELKNFDALLLNSKKAITYHPDKAFFYLINGLASLQKDSAVSALNSFKIGVSHIEKDNKNLLGQFYSNMGDVYYSLKQVDSSFFYYDKALLLDENNITVLNNYSYYLSLENKRLDEAERMVAKCVEWEPGNSTYLDTYAWVLFKRKRFFEAKYIIERAIDNGGGDSDVVVEHYGDILFMNKDTDNAIKQWNKSLKMGNKSEVLLKKIEGGIYIE